MRGLGRENKTREGTEPIATSRATSSLGIKVSEDFRKSKLSKNYPQDCLHPLSYTRGFSGAPLDGVGEERRALPKIEIDKSKILGKHLVADYFDNVYNKRRSAIIPCNFTVGIRKLWPPHSVGDGPCVARSTLTRCSVDPDSYMTLSVGSHGLRYTLVQTVTY